MQSLLWGSDADLQGRVDTGLIHGLDTITHLGLSKFSTFFDKSIHRENNFSPNTLISVHLARRPGTLIMYCIIMHCLLQERTLRATNLNIRDVINVTISFLRILD